MIYVTTRCPHCSHPLRYQKGNPPHLIESPFVTCSCCGKVFIDSYRSEWITKSPSERKLFILGFGEGTIARALLLPLVLSALVFGAEDIVYLIPIFGVIGIPLWWAFEVKLRKKSYKEDIEASIERTKNAEYVELLKSAGFKIYPFDT